jgi:hypothetical protein
MVELSTTFAETAKGMHAANSEAAIAFTETLDKIAERNDAHQTATNEVLRQLTANCASRGVQAGRTA